MSKTNLTSIVIFSLFTTLSSATYAGDELDAPINCATAEGDIRALNSEKAHISDQLKAGVSAVVPVSAFAHLLTGDSGNNLKVASGDYNDEIDKKIAAIKSKCGM